MGIVLSLAAFLGLAAKALAGGGGHALTRATLASSLGYFVITASLGALMAQGLTGAPLLAPDPLVLIQLHLHLGLFGFAALMIFGVSYELLPMFGLARNFSTLPGWVALILGHLGILTLSFSAFVVPGTASWGGLLWPWMLASSCLAYAFQVFTITWNSLRRQREPGPLHFRAAVVILLAGVAWGLRLQLSPEKNLGASAAYVYLLLFGFVGGSILGQLHKILPLLAWYDRFSGLAGKAKIPSAADLMPARWPWLAPALHLAACALGFSGLTLASPALVRLSGAAGGCCFLTVTLMWMACRRRGTIHLSIPAPGILS